MCQLTPRLTWETLMRNTAEEISGKERMTASKGGRARQQHDANAGQAESPMEHIHLRTWANPGICVYTLNTPIATGLLTGHPKQYDNLTAGGWALKAGKGPASPAGGGDNTDKPYHSSRELFLGLNIHVFSSIFWQNIECSRWDLHLKYSYDQAISCRCLQDCHNTQWLRLFLPSLLYI